MNLYPNPLTQISAKSLKRQPSHLESSLHSTAVSLTVYVSLDYFQMMELNKRVQQLLVHGRIRH